MSGDIVLGIRLTGDGKGLVGEVRLSREELDKFRKSADSVRGSAQGAGRGLDDMGRGAKTAAREVEQMDGLAAKATRSLTGWLAGIVTVTVALRTMRASILAASEAEQSQARLAAVLRATGHAAGLTAREINRMTDEMAGSTLFGEEQIRNASAVLLTFRNVQGDTFRELMSLAAGAASVLGGDLTSTVFQFGKAFQDPVEGLDMLKRAGVNFTPVQEEMIKKFMRVNDIAGAHKIIMDEIRSKYGDAAKEMKSGITAATDELAKSWKKLLETFGRTPEMQTATKGVMGGLSSMMDDFTARLGKHGLIKGAAVDFLAPFVNMYDAVAGGRRGDRFGLGQTLKGARDWLNAEPVNIGPSSETTKDTDAGAVDQARAGASEAAARRALERRQAAAIAARNFTREQRLATEQIEFETRLLGQNELAQRIATESHKLDVEVKKRSWEATVEETAALREAAEVLKGEYAAAITESYEANRRWETGARAAFQNYAEDATNAAKQVEGVLTRSLQSSEDAFVKFARTGKLEMSDLFNTIADEALRAFYRMQVAGPISNVLAGIDFAGLFSGGQTGYADHEAYTGGGQAAFMHTGGIVGEGRDMRVVPAHLFDGARRFHTGGMIGADEVPIVARRGEGVFTPQQMRALGGGAQNVRVEIVNQGTPQEVASAQPSFDADGMVVRIATRDVRVGGQFSRALEGTYGLRRVGG